MAESDGSILFTVISLVPSDIPFTVQVCTRESDPQSAEGLLTAYLTIILKFKGGTIGSRLLQGTFLRCFDCICVYVHTYIHTHTHIYIHTHIHTHTHTHTLYM